MVLNKLKLPMKLPLTLSYYISRNFIFFTSLVFGLFFVLIFFVDVLELLRKASGKEIPISTILEMVVLKMPLVLQQILPFIIMLGSSLTYSSLAKRSELVVIRSSGISGVEFLLPAAVTALLCGIIVICLLSPLSAAMISRFKLLEAKYLENKQSNIAVSDSGVWIRQKELYDDQKLSEEDLKSKNDFIIHAKQISKTINADKEELINLNQVMVLVYNPSSEFLYRIDADSAFLEGAKLRIPNPKITYDNAVTERKPEINLYTNLIQDDIDNGFPEPEEISFWHLKDFIQRISLSGFSTIKHNMAWQKYLSLPFLYFAMAVIGAVFSLKSARHSNFGISVFITIATGFIIYFTSNLIFSLGLSGSLPIPISAWVPVLLTLILGAIFLIQFEET